MNFIKQFISEQITADPIFEELYKKAKWEEQKLIELKERDKLSQVEQDAVFKIENKQSSNTYQ